MLVFAIIRGEYDFEGWTIQKFCTFNFFFILVTNWWMHLHFYHKKPIAHDVLSDETQVETKYVKFNFKVTPDKMETFSFNYGQYLHK